jgi:hypothetical protein
MHPRATGEIDYAMDVALDKAMNDLDRGCRQNGSKRCSGRRRWRSRGSEGRYAAPDLAHIAIKALERKAERFLEGQARG